MSGKTVSESVRRDVFVDPCQFIRSPDRSSDGAGREVVAPDGIGARIAREFIGGEDILPDPLLMGLGVFSFKGVG